MTAATEALAPGGTRFASRSALWLFWQRFREDQAAVGAAVVIVVLIVIAIVGGPIAQALTGHSNNEGYEAIMENSFGLPKGPNAQFWFGADGSGRDLFVRTMYGARTSLTVGVVASGIALVIGLLAGSYRGRVDTALSRVGDVMLAMPSLLISIGIVAACNSGINGCLD